jgi:hypothetical protein
MAQRGQLSSVWPVQSGMPRGSVGLLGPLLIIMDAAELSEAVEGQGMLLHQYAATTDDGLAYTAVPTGTLQRWLSSTCESCSSTYCATCTCGRRLFSRS